MCMKYGGKCVILSSDYGTMEENGTLNTDPEL